MKGYNLRLSVDALLPKTDVSSPIAPTFSSMLTLMDQTKLSKWQHDFSLSSTMGYGSIFIGLKWIEMVEILVGEVDRRSPKHGSWAQLTHVNRDKVFHEAFDLEASWSLSFSLFTKGTAPAPWWHSGARDEPLFKQREKAVPLPIFNTTQAMLKKVLVLSLRVEAVLRFLYANLTYWSRFSLQVLGMRQKMDV